MFGHMLSKERLPFAGGEPASVGNDRAARSTACPPASLAAPHELSSFLHSRVNPPSASSLAPLPCPAYFGSLLATLYVSLVMHSYLFSLLFCGAQVCWGGAERSGGWAGAVGRRAAQGRAPAPLPWPLTHPHSLHVNPSPTARHTCVLRRLTLPRRHLGRAGAELPCLRAHGGGGCCARVRLPPHAATSSPLLPSSLQSVIGLAGRGAMSLGGASLRAIFTK
jgi:hypothetical protein